MTKQEAIKVLAYIKTAYPNAFRGAEDVKSVVGMWAIHFERVPFELVMAAVEDITQTNTFTPSISEVKERLYAMYQEADAILKNHNRYCAPMPECCKRCTAWENYMESVRKCGAVLCPRQISDETKAKYELTSVEVKKLERIREALNPKVTTPTLKEKLTGMCAVYELLESKR